MCAFLATLVGLSLLSTVGAIHVGHSRHTHSKRDITHEDDAEIINGVPVYHDSDGTNGVNSVEETEYLVVLNKSTTCQQIDDYCADPDGPFFPCTTTSCEGTHFLKSKITKGKLRSALNDPAVSAQLVDKDMKTQATHSKRDFSRYLIDDNEEAATWGLNRINRDSAPAAGFGVHAYVMDTGVRTTHSQFEGRAIPQLESLGSVRKCECQNDTCAGDTHGHGTHCAGTIAGVDYGVAPQTRIHAVKVLNDNGYGYTSWSIAAESWILSNGMRPAIVSMSLGGSGNNYAEKASIDALISGGIPVVVAAGNEADDACNYNPAWIPNAITVGSTTSSDGLSWFSNYGTCVDILAPGSSILSAGHISDTATSYKSGTSMACPHVSGAVSILFSLNQAMTPAQIIAELTSEAESGAISSLPGGTVNLLLQADSLSGR